MTDLEGYAAWLAMNPAPDLQELVRQYGTYAQIPLASRDAGSNLVLRARCDQPAIQTNGTPGTEKDGDLAAGLARATYRVHLEFFLAYNNGLATKLQALQQQTFPTLRLTSVGKTADISPVTSGPELFPTRLKDEF